LEAAVPSAATPLPALPALDASPPASAPAANDPPLLDFDPSAWPSSKR
jgi:hypothetical protein